MTQSELDKFCMSLPGTAKDVKWGNDLCYTVGGKIYAATTLKELQSISFKATSEEFAELTEIEGIIPALYAARYYWVTVENLKAIKPTQWKKYIQKSYDLILEKLPKKIREALMKK